MIILTIKTDNPIAEIAVYTDNKQLAHRTWEAHLALAESISTVIKEVLSEASLDQTKVEGIAVFKGPGSFTGLRIGVSVANAMADGYAIPIVGTEGELWTEEGIRLLLTGNNDTVVLPQYGSDPHITLPKK